MRAFVAMAAFTFAAMAAPGAMASLDPDRALAASAAAIGSRPGTYAFTDTAGRRVTLADFRGRPLVVSFVYTGCSQVCPTTTRFLAKAVREARAVVGAEAFRVVSIGFDIPADNPVSLRVFARAQGIDDPLWSFLTPDAGMPAALARDFGFSFEGTGGGFEHLTQVTILDAEGRIHAQVAGETYALPMLVQPLRELALGAPVERRTFASLVDRVRLVCTKYDPLTGKYRLDYGLFIELGVGFVVLGLTLLVLVRERRRARRTC